MNISSLLKATLLFTIISLSQLNANAQTDNIADRYPVIPYPVHLTPETGSFVINAQTVIVAQDNDFKDDADALIDLVKDLSGISLKNAREQKNNSIILKKDNTIKTAEGYQLTINADNIEISARTSAGIFWGIETIRQLLPPSANKAALKIPAVKIEDQPAFGWRGIHLDVARHFFSITYLKKFIDRMALYKLNKLHLHLTDDEGWRIQIKKYPQLTEQGAWRTFDHNDSTVTRMARDNPDFTIDSSHIIHKNGKTLYGGFYTQSQMRDLIRYAAERHVEIIPELDMPGHMMAAIKIFPYLSCTGEAGHGKLFSVPLCPCKESTYQFAENVYKEIFALFPSKYVHIGGDEVDKKTWGNCADCKVLMQKEGIKNVNQLQSYFNKRMEKFFHENGKQMIAWDDVLEGGVDSSITIMYWRGWVPKAPVEAANNGNNVIMAPGNPLYFDQFPDKSSLYNVYHFNPVPDALSASPAKNKIIGIQACVWTERIPSERRADFMTMPRMTAMAEVAWNDHRSSDYQSYQERLKSHYHRWDLMHIHYRLPDLSGFTDNNVFTDSTVLSVQKPLQELVIHYTTNGEVPTEQSAVLPGQYVVNHSETIKLAAFSPSGNRGDIYALHYKQEDYSPAVQPGATVSDGLKCLYYKGGFDSTANMESASLSGTYTVTTIEVPKAIKAPAFGLQYQGYINIAKTGIYSFYLTSDDGSRLLIDGQTVVDNDGLHSAIEKSGQVALERGLHQFDLNFIEGGGGYTLRLQYSQQGNAPQDMPAVMLRH